MNSFKQTPVIGSPALSAVRAFLHSDTFKLGVTVIAALFFLCKQEVVGAIILGFIIGAVFVLSDDLSPATLPFLLIGGMVLRMYDSGDVWMRYFDLIYVLVPVFASHFVIYRPRYRIGKMFFPILAVAVAVTLGGAAVADAQSYFSPTNLYYVGMLGFGMLLIYVIFYNHIGTGSFDYRSYIAKAMLYFGAFLVFMLLSVYVENLGNLLNGELPQLQMGNNLSANLLLTMPFAFYYCGKSRYPTVSFCFGLLQYLCLILSLSRGGMLFGTVMIIPCMAYGLKQCGHNDKKYIAAILSLSALLIAMVVFLYFDNILALLDIKSNEARVNLFRHAVKCFVEHPFLGVGLCYDPDLYYHPVGAAMYWYHSTPFQVIASMGTVGIIAYTYQFISRVRLLKRKKDAFFKCLMLSFIGFELLALVNPGDFCPLPYVVTLTLLFVIAEKDSADNQACRTPQTESIN